MIKIGDQVITSRGRYGKVINIDNNNKNVKCLVRIGDKDHWIYEDQLTPPNHTIRLKVTYNFDFCGKNIEDSIEVALKKDTILSENNNDYLCKLCKEIIKAQINMDVNINQIKIS